MKPPLRRAEFALLLPLLATPLAAPLAAQAPAAAIELPADRAVGAATITEARLRTWLGTLASPEFGGRGTGQDGYRLAAEYVRDHFERLGLEPGCPDGSYFQVVPWVRTGPNAARSGLTISRGDEVVWKAGLDALRGSASQDEAIDGPLVLVVTGTTNGDDLAGLDLTGAAVVAVPRPGLFDPDALADRRARRSVPRDLVQLRANVSKAGGKLVAVADDTVASVVGEFATTTGPGQASGGRTSAGRGRMPTITAIDGAAFAALLTAAGSDLELGAVTAPARIELPGVTAALRIEIVSEQAPAFNVVAIVRGSDPDLRDEYVGVGCHLDHLGTSADGTVSPGADDDGSGSTGLMAIAEALAANPTKPRRSVILMAFCGEERGLIGSSYFAAHPTVPLEKIIAELQCDMIGRNEERGDPAAGGEAAADNVNSLHLVGSQKLSSDLHELCVRLNDERAHFDLEWDEENVFYRSDHWNFAREGVPIAFFFTGFHPDYHRPSDTPDKIDYAKLRRISAYVYDLAFELANAEHRPMVDAERWEALARKGRPEPVAPVRR